MTKHTQILVSLSATALLLAIPSAAHASLDACGGAQLSVLDECEVVPEETCTVQCDKDAMDTACAAQLYDDCEEECEPAPDPKCVETCEEICTPTCQEQDKAGGLAGALQVVAVLCVSSCEDDCSVDCLDSEDKDQCDATCEKTCGEVCEKYEPEDKEPACEPSCSVACEGTCQAQAATQCQVQCQSQKAEQCKTRMAEECDEECTKNGAAVFCEKQYIAARVQQDCTDQIQAEMAIVVKNATPHSDAGTAERSGPSASNAADADQGAGCTATIDAGGGLGGVLMALGIVGLGITRRRNRASV